jgi:hypothetical protein
MSDGANGAHGGSGLSSVGGTIRTGELLDSTGPIAHALKLELYAHEYYYGGSESPCFAWPALGCDSYAHSGPSNMVYNGTNPYLKPGALLAVPSAVAPSVKTTTVPGRKILAALTTYGGYLVDDTADDTGSLCMVAWHCVCQAASLTLAYHVVVMSCYIVTCVPHSRTLRWPPSFCMCTDSPWTFRTR